MVEPVAGLFGAVAVVIAEPLLPYMLAFAAGAMIYVVFDDIVPEAQAWSVTGYHRLLRQKLHVTLWTKNTDNVWEVKC